MPKKFDITDDLRMLMSMSEDKERTVKAIDAGVKVIQEIFPMSHPLIVGVINAFESIKENMR